MGNEEQFEGRVYNDETRVNLSRDFFDFFNLWLDGSIQSNYYQFGLSDDKTDTFYKINVEKIGKCKSKYNFPF